MFKIYDGRSDFYQWDTGRKLIVSDPDITQVHFSDIVDGTALVCDVYDYEGVRVADVPNILLQTEWKINAYAYLKDHTKVSAAFKVIARPKPADYVYTETEVRNYDSLLEMIENISANSGGYKQITTNCWLQELEEGIYTVYNGGSNSPISITVGSGNSNKLNMNQGSFLIVSNNLTINNANRSFKKHFIAVISHSVAASNYLKCGELYCKSITVDGVKDWEYEVNYGDMLHSGDLKAFEEELGEMLPEVVADIVEGMDIGGSGSGVDLITEFEGIDTNYEENQVYNANVINEIFEMYAELLIEIQEQVGTIAEDYQTALSLVGGAE